MFKFDKLSAGKLYVAPSVERVVEFSPPGIDVENIAKVLSLAVDGKCISVTPAAGYADVEGRANFRLVYLDKEGIPRGVDYNADFTVRAEGDFGEDDSLSAAINVVESDVEANGGLTLSAVLEVCVSATKREEIEALCDAEKCYKTCKTIILPSFVAAKTVTVPVDDEAEVGEVSSVLAVDSRCVVKKAEAVENGVKLDAEVYATVTYVENEEIKEKTFEIAVSEELNIEGAAADDAVCAESMIKNPKIVLQGVTDDNIIHFECEIQFKIQVFRCTETEVVDDMFMLTNEVELKREICENDCFAGYKYFSERVSGTAMLGDNRAAARDIAALPYAGCYTSKSETNEDGLTAEGIVNTDIIYSDENGYNSVRTEVPFSVTIAGEFSSNVKVRCEVETIGARVKRDREIEVNLNLAIGVCEYAKAGGEYVKEVVVGEEKEQNTSALSMYIGSAGEGMWDVCKALSATPEEILAQNPALQPPLADGEKVLFFRKLSV